MNHIEIAIEHLKQQFQLEYGTELQIDLWIHNTSEAAALKIAQDFSLVTKAGYNLQKQLGTPHTTFNAPYKMNVYYHPTLQEVE